MKQREESSTRLNARSSASNAMQSSIQVRMEMAKKKTPIAILVQPTSHQRDSFMHSKSFKRG